MMNLTQNELKVVRYMAEEAMDACCADDVREAQGDYCAPCTVEELASNAGSLTVAQMRGVCTSLQEKGVIQYEDRAYWLTPKGFDKAEALLG